MAVQKSQDLQVTLDAGSGRRSMLLTSVGTYPTYGKYVLFASTSPAIHHRACLGCSGSKPVEARATQLRAPTQQHSNPSCTGRLVWPPSVFRLDWGKERN